MGLFSRNEPEAGSGRSTPRSSSSEARASELRGRARRRLIGALALVLAAIIVVPMVLDTSSNRKPVNTPAVAPVIVPPAPSSSSPASVVASTEPGKTGGMVTDGTNAPSAPADTTASPTVDAATSDAGKPVAREAAAPEVKPESKPEAKPKVIEKKVEPKHEAKPKTVERTDDGAVAIALLEGRTPNRSAPAPVVHGNYVLQIAAYTTDKDAQARHARLVAAGVTNAYVESGTAGGKPTYRLRVGPFPTREAAQAAQARLRALGYDNGFISTK